MYVFAKFSMVVERITGNSARSPKLALRSMAKRKLYRLEKNYSSARLHAIRSSKVETLAT